MERLPLIDAHFHLESFLRDADSMAERARAAGVFAGISAGVFPDTCMQVLAARQELLRAGVVLLSRSGFVAEWRQLLSGHFRFGIFLGLGLHPGSIGERWFPSGNFVSETKEQDFKEFERLVFLHADDIWCLGEAGFDLSKGARLGLNGTVIDKMNLLECQQQTLQQLFSVASATSLPVVIHSRQAWKVTRDFIATCHSQRVAVMLHCYSGPAEEVQWLTSLGIWLSFGGVTTWTEADKVKRAMMNCPVAKLLIETDAPDLAPQNHRGLRNEPAFLAEIITSLAQLRGEDFSMFASQSTANLLRWLGIVL